MHVETTLNSNGDDMSIKLALPIAAVALAGALVITPAQARSDVQWSIQIGLPLPVLPIFVPGYETAPVYTTRAWDDRVHGGPVYARPVWRDRDRDGIPDWRDRRDNRYRASAWRADRDHDGVPDRYDRHDGRRGSDRDRDGHPDWRDRRDHRP